MFYSEALQGLVVHQEQDLDVWIPIDIVFSTIKFSLLGFYKVGKLWNRKK